MNIIPKELESYDYWGKMRPADIPYNIAGVVQLINEWAEGIEVAGTARQLRYPEYHPGAGTWVLDGDAEVVVPDEI